MRSTEQRTSLGELEGVIEPRAVHDAVYKSVDVLLDALNEADIGRVLNIVQSRDDFQTTMLINGFERKKSGENKAQVEGSIEAIRNLTKLLSGDHPLILDRKKMRERLGYDEKRSDGSSLESWVAEHSKKVITKIQRTLSPSPSMELRDQASNMAEKKGGKSDSANHTR